MQASVSNRTTPVLLSVRKLGFSRKESLTQSTFIIPPTNKASPFLNPSLNNCNLVMWGRWVFHDVECVCVCVQCKVVFFVIFCEMGLSCFWRFRWWYWVSAAFNGHQWETNCRFTQQEWVCSYQCWWNCKSECAFSFLMLLCCFEEIAASKCAIFTSAPCFFLVDFHAELLTQFVSLAF